MSGTDVTFFVECTSIKTHPPMTAGEALKIVAGDYRKWLSHPYTPVVVSVAGIVWWVQVLVG